MASAGIGVLKAFLAVAAFYPFFFPLSTDVSHYRSLFLSGASSRNDSISNHLFILTRRPHVAGSEANAEAAGYVLSTLTSLRFDTRVAPYDILLTYPVSRSLSLNDPPTEFTLRQEIYNGDPYANVADQVQPTYHGYAKSGNAVGPVVYVNYGRVDDYAVLAEMGVNVSGSVVLAKYGKIFRGDIVQNAQDAGAVGALIYTDRKDYGGGGGDAKWFPDDKWMPPTGVQVGSVYNGVGDPTTPGWPSAAGCERLSIDEAEKTGDLVMIPSLPISWADGEVIMRSIGGEKARDDWQGGVDAPVYRVGPGPGIVNLTYQGNHDIKRIENVVGIIEGEQEPDRFVILGNHRDAWTFGAADPNSGTASLLDVAERLQRLRKKGWKPRRTIILCNWDAEEPGLIGSTEWVEENRQVLMSKTVAYLNVDIAVCGTGFEASATPQLDELIKEIAKQVPDPDNSSQTLYDSWSGSMKNPLIGRLGGGGSDFSPFLHHIGIPATDVSYGEGYPVYHSMYDDFIWMSRYGDPGFHRHVAVSNFWGLLALRLADDEILPFNYLSYAAELQKGAQSLKDKVLNKGIATDPLLTAISQLEKAAISVNEEIQKHKGGKGWIGSSKHGLRIRDLNDRLMMTERAFIDREGLQERPWYKHLIFAPAKHDDYGSSFFPGIADALENAERLNTTESWHEVQHEVWRVSRVITQASLYLKGVLT